MRGLWIFSAVIGTCLLAGAASAEPMIHAFDRANRRIVTFDALSPETLISSLPLSGFLPYETIAGIDFRPATGELYGLAHAIGPTSSRLVRIDLQTGVIASVGSSTSQLNGDPFGVDFDPAADVVRVVNQRGQNARLSPVDGSLLGLDTNLHYRPDDVGAGGPSPYILQIAYGNNVAGAATSTLYGIDFQTDSLVRIGGVDGDPSANLGEMSTIGSLGVVASQLGGAFDIEAGSGDAYAILPVASRSRLYRIDLATGAATPLGIVGGGNIDGMAIARPERIFASGFEAPPQDSKQRAPAGLPD